MGHSRRETLAVYQHVAVDGQLAAKYPRYQDQPFADLLVFGITGLSGWSGADDGRADTGPA